MLYSTVYFIFLKIFDLFWISEFWRTAQRLVAITSTEMETDAKVTHVDSK